MIVRFLVVVASKDQGRQGRESYGYGTGTIRDDTAETGQAR